MDPRTLISIRLDSTIQSWLDGASGWLTSGEMSLDNFELLTSTEHGSSVKTR